MIWPTRKPLASEAAVAAPVAVAEAAPAEVRPRKVAQPIASTR